jgi:hypothetical protein
MAIKTIILEKQTRTFHSLPVIEFGQGETLRFRLADTDNDLNGAILLFSLREGLNNPFQSLVSQPELVSNTQRNLTVSGGFADFFVNYNETKNWGVGNKTYTLEVKIKLSNGFIYQWGKYETRISENLVSGLASSVNFLNYFATTSEREFWLSPRDTSTLTLSGSNITQINDKTPNARNFVSSAGQELVLNSAGINGVPVMVSDGIADKLTLATIKMTVFTLYLVVSPTGSANKIFDATSAYYLFGTVGSTSEVSKASVSGRNFTTNWATASPAFKIIEITYGGTNATHTMSINGGANVLTGTGAEVGGGEKISGVVNLGQMAGMYGDVLLFGRVLTASEKLEITSELKSIYSII